MIDPSRLERARACIADTERSESSLATQVDAAVMAAIFLEDKAARRDSKIAEYLVLKYERPLSDTEFAPCLAHALSLAKTLLSTLEREARAEAAETVHSVAHSMLLSGKPVGAEATARNIEQLTAEILEEILLSTKERKNEGS